MMKRILLYKIGVPVFVFFAVISLAKGQSATNFQVSLAKSQSLINSSLGIRVLGHEKGIGGEVSYQRRFLERNRLEMDLGIRNEEYTGTVLHNARLTAIYQRLWNIPERYVFYIGLGVGYGHWYYNVKEKKYSDNGNYSYLVGQVGVEYNFEYIPFSVSLDCRPEYINNWWMENKHFVGDVAFSIRYKF